jgi:hypothetical protein
MVPLAVTAITKWCNDVERDESCGRRPAGPLSGGSRLSSLNQAAAAQQARSKPKP